MIHAVFADEQEVARRAGVPLEGIAAAVRGGGLSLSYLDVAAFDRFAGLSGTTFQELSHQTGIPLELLAVVREAFGFAETETAGWRSQVEGPLLASGMTGAEMLTAQAELGSPAGPHGRAGPAGDLPRPAGTRLDPGFRREGDQAAAEVAARLARLVRRAAQNHGGAPVKWLGDGVMCYFRDPAAGVLAALEMVEAAAGQGLPPAHVRIHAGPVVFQDGDYFGRTVNQAARIAEYDRPGEVLVSREVIDATDHASVAFTEIGPVEFKSIPRTLRLSTAQRHRPRPTTPTAQDTP